MARETIGGPGRNPAGWLFWAGLLAAVALGGGLRWPGIRAAYPYLTYVDEGHVLQNVRQTLATGRWDPSKNPYPELAIRTVVTAARVLSPLHGRLSIAPRAEQARDSMSYYDRVEPPELILLARSISWLLSLATIALAGLFGRRLGGPAAGVVAAWAAALVPALVMRGAIAMVDGYATFFTLAALTAVPLADRGRFLARAFAAGACCGLAAISKYPAVLILVGIGLTLCLLPGVAFGRKLRALAATAAGAALAAAVLMPSTWRQPAAVVALVLEHGALYNTKVTQTLWNQMFERQEFDLPQIGTPELGYLFAALACIGFAVLVFRRETRACGIGSAVYVGSVLALSNHYTFVVFRNVLPTVPIACVAVGAAFGALGEKLRRPWMTAGFAMLVLLALFLPAGLASARYRMSLVDSRQQAIDWLLAHRQRQQPLLVADELALPALETQRLGARTVIAAWPEWRSELQASRPRFLLTGDLSGDDGQPLIPAEDRAWILRRYRVAASFGDQPSSNGVWAWRGNRLRVWVLQRTPRAAASQ
jgi:hypothetical protein